MNVGYYFVGKKIFPKKEIFKIQMDRTEMQKGYAISICYFIISVIIIGILGSIPSVVE